MGTTTSPTSSTTAQSNYSDNQTYKIDIEKVYTSLIQEIDKIRSNVSTKDIAAQLKSFIVASTNSTQQSSILSQLSIDPNNVQESRCHAYYRLLGLPVFEPDGLFYSPGRNNQSDKKSDYTQLKQQVASKIPDDLYSLMNNREITINNYLKVFSIQDINSSVIALASTKIRKFNVIESIAATPLDTNTSSQSYTIDNSTTNLDTTPLSFFTDYTDSNRNKISSTTQGLLQRHLHIIAPFMVDPRLELTTNPPYIGVPTNNNTAVCKLVGAPFAIDKTDLAFVENIYASRPIIETVCRKRLNTAQPESTLSQRFQDLLNYVKNANIANDPKLLDKVFQNPTQIPEDQVFLQYINIMRAMIDKLVESITIITDTSSQYHWVPIPNIKGPEFGCTTQGIIISDTLNTEKDIAIINAIVQQQISQINAQSTQVTEPDLGNFSVDFEKTLGSPDSQTTDALGDRTQNNLDDMISKRTAKTDAANNALREIEIIMGEFSGLGLCDIIAIYLALWTIDQTTLVSMLDDEAFKRLATITELQAQAVLDRISNNNSPTSDNDIITVMTKFEQKVSEIYSVMDKLLIDKLQTNTS